MWRLLNMLTYLLQSPDGILFLTCPEAHRARLVCQEASGVALLALSVKRQLAYRRIARQVRKSRGRRWMDVVIKQAVSFHFFPNRLEVNLSCLQAAFRVGLAGNDALFQRASYWKGALPTCPRCEETPCTQAIYSAVGKNMFKSHPFLVFGCARCLLPAPESFYGDFYHEPKVITFPWRSWEEVISGESY